MDYDQIVVLDNGSVVEQGTVQELLNREEGVFKGMVKEQNKNH
jgi:ABC-type multidrug transport system fused ATPase/permease subunit